MKHYHSSDAGQGGDVLWDTKAEAHGQSWLLTRAAAIADQIRSQAVQSPDGSLTWLGPRQNRQQAPSPYLYDGAAGISLFFAAMYHVSGDGECRETSLRALAPLRRKLAEVSSRPRTASRLNLKLGGFIGLGSFIYSFPKIGQMLGEPELLREAHDLVGLLSPEMVSEDHHLDVVFGGAGMVLALLALQAAASPFDDRRGTLIELASLCAEHLLSARKQAEQGHTGWRTVQGQPPLSGFSHGAAGICHALSQLYRLTGRQDLKDAIQEGLAFERELYSPAHKNWRDLRFPDGRFMTSWCHGAPGIALSRLAMLDLIGDPQIREEIRDALETTRSLGLTLVDHLCCGNFGRGEIMLYAYQKLGSAGLLDEARTLASQAVRRAEASGHFGRPRKDGFVNPSFFLGTAGMGYALLRLHNPGALPCVLLLE